ncbi:MAG TPA: cyclic nucleotide-binding domain-containing protein [Acidimicrobiales bacterium]|nr:cyclic nucleotide-binding domain-containing protein [Acidimicrobiales bacterium]HUE08011.1 cyclic nucleotide-binding domain-containing protein [Acidimicrobiales bacterium]
MRGRIPKQEIELLKQVPIFSSCSREELRAIAQLGSKVDVEEGTVLTEKGKPGHEFFLVLEGVASCNVGRHEVRRFGPGQFFGEMALLHGGVRSADVVAKSDMRLLALDSREFKSMLTTTPYVGIKMLANLAERLSDADDAYTA